MEFFGLAFILGFIPAMIAKSKGRSFFPWYLYGFFIFIIALVHSILIKDTSPTSNDITPETHMTCPDCKEFVRIGARKCKHCGYYFANEELRENPWAMAIDPECEKVKKTAEDRYRKKKAEWLKQGAELLEAEDYEAAIAKFTEAIDESPSGELYYGRSIAYSKVQDQKSTVSDLQAAANFGHQKAKETLATINAAQ